MGGFTFPMPDLIDLLAGLQQSQDAQPFSPVIIGFCHSYDHSTGEENQRRIRVNYVAPDGSLTVSPLLYRCAMSPGSDPQMPALQSLVIGLWTKVDRSAGVWLGFVQNTPLVTNFDPVRDWTEVVDGVLTLRAERVRIISETGIELIAGVDMPNYSHVTIGDDATGSNASDIKFRDGFECEIKVRDIYNAVFLDESADL